MGREAEETHRAAGLEGLSQSWGWGLRNPAPWMRAGEGVIHSLEPE